MLLQFRMIIKSKGIEVKIGKHIAFKLENLGQQRFTRGKTLGADYAEEKLKFRIEERNKKAVNNKEAISANSP